MEQKDKFDQLEAENQELLALTKQAFVKREVEKESVPADQEWEKFAAEHADELETLEKDEPHTVTITKLMGILPYKVAASIIGILFTAGVAFAAIHIVRHFVGEDVKSPTQEVQIPNSRCYLRLHHIIIRRWTSRTTMHASSVSILYGNRTRR